MKPDVGKIKGSDSRPKHMVEDHGLNSGVLVLKTGAGNQELIGNVNRHTILKSRHTRLDSNKSKTKARKARFVALVQL